MRARCEICHAAGDTTPRHPHNRSRRRQLKVVGENLWVEYPNGIGWSLVLPGQLVCADFHGEIAPATVLPHEVMRPRHPRWDEFYDRLEGPEGCNFHEKTPGDRESVNWDCTSETDRPHARKILASMGFTPIQIEATLHYFSSEGGLCDCEILFNVNPQPPALERKCIQ